MPLSLNFLKNFLTESSLEDKDFGLILMDGSFVFDPDAHELVEDVLDHELYMEFIHSDKWLGNWILGHQGEGGPITPDAGLWLDNDTSPTSSSVLSAKACLIDEDTDSDCTGIIQNRASVGLDLGSAKTWDTVTVRLMTTVGDFTSGSADYYSSSADTFEVYSSDDNSTWSLIQSFNAPTLVKDGQYTGHVVLELNTPQESRYLKVRADSIGWAQGVNGENFRVAELEVAGGDDYIYTEYVEDDVVTSNGYDYRCKSGHTASEMSQPGVGGVWTTYWELEEYGGYVEGGVILENMTITEVVEEEQVEITWDPIEFVADNNNMGPISGYLLYYKDPEDSYEDGVIVGFVPLLDEDEYDEYEALMVYEGDSLPIEPKLVIG